MHSRLVLLFVVACIEISSGQLRSVGAAEYWSQYRGPANNGHSTDMNVPSKWDTQQLQWKSDLPVFGHSTPIVWEDKIFLTGATSETDGVARHVMCVDLKTGEVLWDKKVATAAGETLHKMNSWATPSCATDGTCVAAFFGPGGLHCLDFDGNVLWSRQLGEFPGDWGVGASPIFVGDALVQNCDAQGESYLVAIDKKTGKDIWNVPREDKPKGGWSTPVVYTHGGQTELLLNGEFGVNAYDPQTGQSLWSCASFNGRGTPMPVVAKGVAFLVNGKSGDVYAVRCGGRGDVTSSHMVWHTPRKGGRDIPSPVLVDDTLFVISMSGVATGYSANDGHELFKQRVGGNFSGSPIVCNGLVYVLSESGEVVVMKIGKSCEIVARNQLDAASNEIFRSSPSTVEGRLLIRSDRKLYCIGG